MSIDPLQGLLFINKPVGIPSFKVVKYVRSLSHVKRVGFAGTLDPFASGLLVVAIGRSFTKTLDEFLALTKTYRVIMAIGINTDTYDAYGSITKITPHTPNQSQIETTLEQFLGNQIQTSPIYSAKKKEGKRLYSLARKGIEVELPTQEIDIHAITLLRTHFTQKTPLIEFEVICSKGTYIRSLVHDIGLKLQTGAYTKDLCRTKIGNYDIENSIHLHQLNKHTLEMNLKK